MPLMKTKARKTSALTRESEGNDVFLRALRDGTLVMASFVEAMCLEGRVFSVNSGTITSPGSHGDASIDSTEADLMVLAPDGTTIVPLEIVIQMEAYGADGIFEAMLACGLGGTLGTDQDLTPTNINTGSGRTSNCTAGGESAADSVYHTSRVMELSRWGAAKAVTVGTADDDSTVPPPNFIWRAKDEGYFPIIVGAGGFSVYAAASTTTGFIMARWLEVPSTWFAI